MAEFSGNPHIRIGTSGWSYDDWVGPFYPKELVSRKGEWLKYYGGYFDTVEINSTFYRMPNNYMVQRWIEVGSGLGNFEFSLKLPQSITHETLVEAKDADAHELASEFESNVAAPLSDNKLLGCLLIQLSPYFRRIDSKTNTDNIRRLEELFEHLSYRAMRYVIEFRHSSWLNGRNDDLEQDTLELLSRYNIGLCKTDGPGFPFTRTDPAAHSYIRFHGRNRDIWFKGRKSGSEDEKESESTDGRYNRYDYLYTEDELKHWVPQIRRAAADDRAEERIYFNNHPHGQAVQNAFMMMDLLGLPRKVKDLKAKKQYTIESF